MPQRSVGALLRAVAATYLAIALFERVAPRRAVRAYQRFANPYNLRAMGWLPGWAVVETTGRRTGRPRQVPVGGRLTGTTFWLVSGDGLHSAFVKNIEADPNVRLRVHGRWRTGRATVMADDDAARRLLRLNPLNSVFLFLANPRTSMLTVRIDLP